MEQSKFMMFIFAAVVLVFLIFKTYKYNAYDESSIINQGNLFCEKVDSEVDKIHFSKEKTEGNVSCINGFKAYFHIRHTFSYIDFAKERCNMYNSGKLINLDNRLGHTIASCDTGLSFEIFRN